MGVNPIPQTPNPQPPKAGALGGARLCGKGRTVGGVYVEASATPQGQAIEAYLVDPPRQIDPKRYGLAAQGMAMVNLGGTWHLMDWVGETYYSVSDFIEEARVMGVSRKVAPNSIDWTKITPASQLMLVHSKAVVINSAQLGAFANPLYCPTQQHQAGDPCLGLHYYEGVVNRNHPKGRKLVQGHYPLRDLGEGAPNPGFAPGIFMRVPIERIAMVGISQPLVLTARVPTAIVEI